MTVSELYVHCKRCVVNGDGNKEVFISSDEEGNKFNKLYFGINANTEDIKALRRMGCLNESDMGRLKEEDIFLLG